MSHRSYNTKQLSALSLPSMFGRWHEDRWLECCIVLFTLLVVILTLVLFVCCTNCYYHMLQNSVVCRNKLFIIL